jgi:hypothetical protein
MVGMMSNKSFTAACAAISALIIATAIMVYGAGYFMAGYVSTFGKHRTRYYKASWVAVSYRPMAKVEELLTGRRVESVQDVCSGGYVMETLSKEMNSAN